MDEITTRLVRCFQNVFPTMPESEIQSATQASVAAWDSVAAITLVNVIEEEFAIQVDFDLLPELDSFGRIRDYLSREMQIPASQGARN